MKLLAALFAALPLFAVDGAPDLQELGSVMQGELAKLADPEVIRGLADGSVKVGVDEAQLARGLKALGLRPFAANGWSDGIELPDLSNLNLDPKRLGEIVPVAIAAVRIALAVERRAQEHRQKLAAKGRAEVPASNAACRFEMDVPGGKLLFDQWGELFIDRRFLKPEEKSTVMRLEKLYRGIYPAKKLAAAPRAQLVTTSRANPGGGALPIFRGFEDARYQAHDALIRKLTADFNAHKAAWCGGTAAQAAKVADLTPAMVKSHMIEETGGNDAGSRAAWAADPLQVNVPGDWGAEKEELGLRRPTKRNEGTAEGNVRAAIMYLSRKGFGVSGQPAARRPSGFFDGWPDALRRYNGRRDRTASGRYYSDDYADKILRRAATPDEYVAIEIKMK